MAEEKKNEVIRQGNPLTESKQDFTKMEKNAYYCVVWQVRRDYVETGRTDFDNMIVEISESRLGDIADEHHKEDARKALMNLRKRDILIRKGKSWFNCGFINWSEYDDEKGVYRLEVSSRIMPYLVEFADNYTEYSLTVAISLKSIYSQRLYELCCQYQKKKTLSFWKTIEQLRSMFVDKGAYQSVADFERGVLRKAKNELKKLFDEGQCDLWFEYLKEGRGEKAKYTFKIHPRNEPQTPEQEGVAIANKINAMYQVMRGIFPKDKKYTTRFREWLTFHLDKVDEVLDTLQSLLNRYKKPDIAPIIRVVLDREQGIK